MKRKTKHIIKQTSKNKTDKDLIQHYNTLFTPDSIELEDIEKLLEQDKIDESTCIVILSNSCKELKADFNNYLMDEYNTLQFSEDRLLYMDIANIARFVIRKLKSNETECFENIFNTVELILKNSNVVTRNLIVVGLFESIQNVCGGHGIDYYKGFDKWLKPNSKWEWDGLITSWEGNK